jgi:isopentenyl-diphosphate delta-isomerase
VSQALTRSQVVSSEQESLILVDSDDRETGFLDKSACHDGQGKLHRAFSLFVFNPAGELLIHQRASGKRLWPDYWSNSCCSHPRRGEVMDQAVQRRLQQELGLQVPLTYLYKFEYQAGYQGIGTEHELCWVYAGRSDTDPIINTNEVRDWQWIDPAELGRQLQQPGNRFTPWFRMEWERIERDFKSALDL